MFSKGYLTHGVLFQTSVENTDNLLHYSESQGLLSTNVDQATFTFGDFTKKDSPPGRIYRKKTTTTNKQTKEFT